MTTVKKENNLFLIIMMFLCMFFYFAYSIFKIQHWPAIYPLGLTIGCAAIILFIAFRRIYLNRKMN